MWPMLLAVAALRPCWPGGVQPLAHAIQSKISEIFAVDIHPAAELGRGVMLDHATGIVIGETAVVGDNVSMLHHVSLGGSGTGTGVTVLGPVTEGAGSKVGAGSVVVTSLPAHCVAVGVPANIVKRNINKEPVREMDQCTDFIPDYVRYLSAEHKSNPSRRCENVPANLGPALFWLRGKGTSRWQHGSTSDGSDRKDIGWGDEEVLVRNLSEQSHGWRGASLNNDWRCSHRGCGCGSCVGSLDARVGRVMAEFARLHNTTCN
ncbi:hypothetical protein QJQ45_013950 [Haematococcus lacustris]|nr:hypothetical protein QJQ45_013950 [Haematococcus lacustris]